MRLLGETPERIKRRAEEEHKSIEEIEAIEAVKKK